MSAIENHPIVALLLEFMKAGHTRKFAALLTSSSPSPAALFVAQFHLLRQFNPQVAYQLGLAIARKHLPMCQQSALEPRSTDRLALAIIEQAQIAVDPCVSRKAQRQALQNARRDVDVLNLATFDTPPQWSIIGYLVAEPHYYNLLVTIYLASQTYADVASLEAFYSWLQEQVNTIATKILEQEQLSRVQLDSYV
jgi:hypothetical protein